MDITIKTEEGYFNHRVGALIIKDDRLLAVKNDGGSYYYTIGGRVKFGESTYETVLREAFEETGIHLETEKLAFVHENFFNADFADNQDFHEVAFFYLMKAHEDLSKIESGTPGADGEKTTLHWLPIDKLSEVEIYPVFIKDYLKYGENEFKHFITKDGKIIVNP